MRNTTTEVIVKVPSLKATKSLFTRYRVELFHEVGLFPRLAGLRF